MRLRSFIFLFFCLIFCSQIGFAQYSVKFKYVKDLPKELFSVPTAAVISYVSNTGDNTIKLNGYTEVKKQLLAYNQDLNIQIVDYANFEAEEKEKLAQQFLQKGVKQLIFINNVEIVAHGTQDTYRLLITKFNGKPTLISDKQKAFSIEAPTFEQLLQTLGANVAMYNKGFFKKSNNRTASYQAAVALSKTLPENEDSTKVNPKLILSAEDMQRGAGGYQGNFYFRPEGSMAELNAGFLGQKLRPYAVKTPASLRYLNKYRTAKWTFLANKVVLFGAIIGYGYEVSREYEDYFNDNQKIYLGVVAGSFIANHFITKKTNYNFRRAVDEYNLWTETKQGQTLNRIQPSGFRFEVIPITEMARTAPSATLYWNIGKP